MTKKEKEIKRTKEKSEIAPLAIKTFSLGKICILIGIKPEKNEDPRDTCDRQGKGINQTSLMA